MTTTQVIEVMRKNGTEIDEEKAEKVLDFMYFLAELIVKQNFMPQDREQSKVEP